MIKTIKVKKSFRLDELIKYVWDEDFSVRGYTVFRSDCDKFEVRASTHMLDYVWDNTSKFSNVPRHATFTVEVEEEITEDTEFDRAIALLLSAQGTRLFSHDYENLTLGKILNSNNHRGLHQVYAMINGKLELIWEAE